MDTRQANEGSFNQKQKKPEICFRLSFLDWNCLLNEQGTKLTETMGGIKCVPPASKKKLEIIKLSASSNISTHQQYPRVESFQKPPV